MIKTKKQQNLVLKASIRKALNDPSWFYNNVLNFPAKEWQIEATNAVLDVRRKAAGIPTIVNHDALARISVRSCHGPGKTQWLGMLMHLWNFITYGKIACTAPKEAQLTRRLIPRYRRAMRDAPREYKDSIKVFSRDIIVAGDADHGAVMETASDPDNLSGFHDEPQLFLVDEASAKRLDQMFPVIDGALTTPGSVVVEIGNPTRTEGEFWSHHNKPGTKELYYRMHIKPSDAPDLISPQWVESMRQKYGEKSPIFLIRVMGEFAAYDEYILIQPEYIEESLDSELVEDGSLPKLRISVDVSDGGADSSVLTVAMHYNSFIYVLKQKAFWWAASESPIKAAETAISMFEAYGGRKSIDEFVVDANGVGSGTAGTLMKLGYKVIRHVGGEASDDPKRWRNRRVQNYIALYEQFMNNTLLIAPNAVDDEEELRAHLLSIKRNVNNERVDDIETKRQIKADGLPSPDRADSLSMQLINIVPTLIVDNTPPIIMGTSEARHYDAGLA